MNNLFENLEKIVEANKPLTLGQIIVKNFPFQVLCQITDEQLVNYLMNTYHISPQATKPVSCEGNCKKLIEEKDKEIAALKDQLAKSQNKDRIYINKDGKVKAVFEAQLDKYLLDGWKKGRK